MGFLMMSEWVALECYKRKTCARSCMHAACIEWQDEFIISVQGMHACKKYLLCMERPSSAHAGGCVHACTVTVPNTKGWFSTYLGYPSEASKLRGVVLVHLTHLS
jgi:hypothetical protein